jgi:hypothetical protein
VLPVLINTPVDLSKSTVRRQFEVCICLSGSNETKKENATKRLQWAQPYAHYTTDDWRRVKWADECLVERGKDDQPNGH